VELRTPGTDTERVHEAVPPPPGLIEAMKRGAGIPALADRGLRPLAVVGLTPEDDDRALAARGQVNRREERGDGPGVVDRPIVRLAELHRVGMREVATAPEEAAPIG